MLLACNYNPQTTLIKDYLACISKEIDSFSMLTIFLYYIIQDFNCEPTEESMTTFCQMHYLKILINEPTCYKNSNNTTCIDLIMTNRPKSFQNSSTFETGQSDFLKATLAVLKVSFKKEKPRVLNYCKYKFYDNSIFREQFLTKVNHFTVSKQDNSFKGFQEKCLKVLNSMAPVNANLYGQIKHLL